MVVCKIFCIFAPPSKIIKYMKRFIVIFLYALCSTYIFAISVNVKPGLSYEIIDDTYRIEFYMPDYQIVTDTLSGDWGDAFFSSIKPYDVDEFDYLHEDGRPTLPFYSLDLILPFGSFAYEVTSVQILDSTVVTLPYDYTPAQERVDFSEGFSFDEEYYNTHEDWYLTNYSIDDSNYRFYKGFKFSLFPCRYVAEIRQLTIVTRAVYEITFNGPDLVNYIQQELSEYDRLAYNFYDNFVEYPQSIIPPINGDKYLIITANEWDDNSDLMEFKHHKESLGYDVLYAKIGDIGEEPMQIRDYIKNLYNEDLKYVLLVGDVSSIPFSEGNNEDVTLPPTDIYYSCLNQDISEQWRDFNPSVFVGRWPVTSEEELRHVVNKTIASDLHLGEHNPNRIGIFSGSGNHHQYIYNNAKYVYNDLINNSAYFTGDHTNLHGLSALTAYSYTQTYLEYANNPTWLYVYFGHGGNGVMGDPSFLYASHYNQYAIESITTNNLDFQSFGFGFSCLLGNIYAPTNFARSWITSEQGGVTFFGATTISYMNVDRYFSRTLFEQLKNKPVMTIGEFVANGKAKYFNPNKVEWRSREVRKYTLYGDPSLYLFGLDFNYNTPRLIKKDSQLTEIQDKNIIVNDDIVQLETDVYGEVNSICVYSVTGQLMLVNYTNQVDLGDLPMGAYTVVVDTNTGKITQKVMKY